MRHLVAGGKRAWTYAHATFHAESSFKRASRRGVASPVKWVEGALARPGRDARHPAARSPAERASFPAEGRCPRDSIEGKVAQRGGPRDGPFPAARGPRDGPSSRLAP
jgi:hypothetical protein